MTTGGASLFWMLLGRWWLVCRKMSPSVEGKGMTEKSWERLFITFVDLKKAYDSVPRQALWRVLGVPNTLRTCKQESGS